MRSVLRKMRVLTVPVLIAALLPIVVFSHTVADAYEINTGAWSGTTAATSTMTLPDGVVVTSAVTAPAAHNGVGTIASKGATSVMFTPAIATSTPTKRVDVNVTGCTYASGMCTNRGTWTLTFSQPVTNAVLHLTGFGGQRTTGGNSARFSAVPVLTGSSPAGATLGAASAGATNMVVTGGSTIDRVNAYADVACNSTSDPNSQAFAGCGSVPVNGTVTSLTFRLDARIAFVSGNPAATIDSGQQDQFEFTVSTSEDFGDAPASYDAGTAAVSSVGDLKLGSTVDADNPTTANATTSPNAVATGANNNGANGDGNDEDAFTTLPDVPATGTYLLTVPISGASKAGQVCGWIDFDKGGTFGTGNEQACASFAAGATSANLSWTVPAGTTPGSTYARFRAAYGTVSGPTGRADSGEVEDYRLAIASTPLTCTDSDIYTLDRQQTGSTTTIMKVNPTTGALSPVGTFPVNTMNALGVTPGGTSAYAVDTVGVVQISPGVWRVPVYRYDAATGAVTTYLSAYPSATTQLLLAGAVDPTNGIYYYTLLGAFGAGTIFAFDTNTNTSIGEVGTFTLTGVTDAAPNGDIAFDGAGNLYIVHGFGAASGIGVIKAADVPSTPNTGVLPTTVLSTGVSPGDGIAFDSSGKLYVELAGQQLIRPFNVLTGLPLGPAVAEAVTGADVTADLGGCVNPPTIAIRKDVVGRVATSDQFKLTLDAPGTGEDQSVTTTGTATGIQAAKIGPVLAISGQPFAVSESAASGNLANYTTTYSCTDAGNGGNIVASGNGIAVAFPGGVFPSPAAGENNMAVTCTFTNAPITPAISLDKQAGTPTDVNGNGITDPGDTIVYDFTVTNTGTVVIHNVKVDDPLLKAAGVAISCPQDTLRPGASMVCTSDPYTVTTDDAAHGSVDNVATTTGTTPGHPVHSPPSTAIVTTHTPGGLPNTGAGFDWWVPLAGMGLFAVGLLMLVARRRRDA